MRVTVVGAGAMGGSYGGLLAASGHEVRLVDIRADHVAAIREDGLLVEGVAGEHRLRLPASTGLEWPGEADVVIFFVDSNATEEAAVTAGAALAPDGLVITFQNGIGNVEKLQAAIGRERVLGGSSMCSAAGVAPGRVRLTHVGPTSVGETDGAESARAADLARALGAAGLPARVEADIMTKIWSKFVLNCCVNALCATTGLRLGEVARLSELDALQDRVIDEVLAVTEAKGIRLPDPDTRATLKAHTRRKFSRPSMLQHVEAGRRTEIDAINGALVREARALGIATPYNEALVALLKGRELKQIRATTDPELDYEAWEARVAAGEE